MIIKSFLDTDWYKLTMGQFIFHNYGDKNVKYKFYFRENNRNSDSKIFSDISKFSDFFFKIKF